MKAALTLPPEQREVLGEALLESAGQEWSDLDMPIVLLEKRLDEMKHDATKRVPLDEVFPELRTREHNG